MLNKNKKLFSVFKTLHVFRMCFASLLLAMCLSCAATVARDESPLTSRIMAENSSIKRRLPLIERENDVLRKENHQHRAKILDLETKIKNLGLELAFLGEKYENDTNRSEVQIKDLQLTLQEIEKESAQRIRSLNASRAALEKKLAREVRVLNNKMTAQREADRQEREQIKKANDKRESALTARIEALNKIMETQKAENASLKKTNREISGKLGEANASTEALRKSRDDAIAELETVKATNARLTRVLNSQ